MQQLMVCIGSFAFRKALFLVSRTNFGFPYYIRQEKSAFITLFGNFLCKQTVNKRKPAQSTLTITAIVFFQKFCSKGIAFFTNTCYNKRKNHFPRRCL